MGAVNFIADPHEWIPKGPLVYGFPVLGILGFIFAGILGLGLAVAILRSGRL